MATNQWKKVGENIRIMRNANGYTQGVVAEYLGLKNHTIISYYESGERSIALEHLNKLADLFGVGLDVILNENPNEQKVEAILAYRKEELMPEDLEKIASFYQIVKGYIKLINIEKEYEKKT